jgi:hypothetical protein
MVPAQRASRLFLFVLFDQHHGVKEKKLSISSDVEKKRH